MFKSSAIGIDLGTSKCCVAVFQNGTVEILPNSHGNRTTPSCVAFTDTERFVGDDARNQICKNPTNTISGSKRLIGQSYESVSIPPSHMKLINVEGKPKHEFYFQNVTKSLACEEVAVMLLANLKKSAELRLGKKVTDAVISVPGQFRNAQRHLILDAGNIAGLNVIGIINETTAAAMAYIVQGHLHRVNVGQHNILVFNMGGGFTEVCIASIEKSIISIKSTAGADKLGGEDFDCRMLAHFVNEFKAAHDKDLSTNKRALVRLRGACEQAKKALSTSEKVQIELDGLFDGIDYNTWITREEFEELNADYFQAITLTVKKALLHANLEARYIHRIVLVGGSTRIPKIQQVLQSFTPGHSLCKLLNPDEGVAYGAAVQAAILQNKEDDITLPLLLGDLTPETLSVKTHEGIFPLFNRHTMYPKTETKYYTTLHDNQDSFVMKVFEGTEAEDKDKNLVGSVVATSIPKALAGVPKIQVTFEIDANGIFRTGMLEILCEGKVATRTSVENRKGGLSQREIRQMRATLAEYVDEDNKWKERKQAMDDLQALCIRIKCMCMLEGNVYEGQFDRKAALEKCNNVVTWLERNPKAYVHECEKKTKELEAAVTPKKKGKQFFKSVVTSLFK